MFLLVNDALYTVRVAELSKHSHAHDNTHKDRTNRAMFMVSVWVPSVSSVNSGNAYLFLVLG